MQCVRLHGEFKAFKGNHLQTIQESLASVEYIITNEMSMVDRKLFGKVAAPGSATQVRV